MNACPYCAEDVSSAAATTVLDSRMHWIVFMRPIFWLVVVTILTIEGSFVLGTFFLAVLLVDGLSRLLLYGRRQSLELVASKVESVSVTTPMLGRLFGYGSVIVTETGGRREAFPYVPDPERFRFPIEQHPSSQS
jgi:hypothetical protein